MSTILGVYFKGILEILHKIAYHTLQVVSISEARSSEFKSSWQNEAMYISLIDFQWTCAETNSYQ